MALSFSTPAQRRGWDEGKMVARNPQRRVSRYGPQRSIKVHDTLQVYYTNKTTVGYGRRSGGSSWMHAEVPGAEHDIAFAAAVKDVFFQLQGSSPGRAGTSKVQTTPVAAHPAVPKS